MRTLLFICCAAITGCASVEPAEEQTETESQSESELFGIGKPSYFFVTPAAPGSTAPFAIYLANGKPSFLQPTKGAGIVTSLVRAGDAKVSQAEVSKLVATPFAGHGDLAVALIAARNKSSGGNTRYEIVELYWPAQPVKRADVQQRDALYQLVPPTDKMITVRNVQVRDYPAESAMWLPFDYSPTVDEIKAEAAVRGGAFFYGWVRVVCSSFLGITSCHAPTLVEVRAVFNAP